MYLGFSGEVNVYVDKWEGKVNIYVYRKEKFTFISYMRVYNMKNKNLQKKRKLLIKLAKLDTTFIKSPGLVKYVKKIIKLVESRNNLSIQISNLNYTSDDYDHIFANIIILSESGEECFGMWVNSDNIDNKGNHKFKHNCIIKRFCEWKLSPQ